MAVPIELAQKLMLRLVKPLQKVMQYNSLQLYWDEPRSFAALLSHFPRQQKMTLSNGSASSSNARSQWNNPAARKARHVD